MSQEEIREFMATKQRACREKQKFLSSSQHSVADLSSNGCSQERKFCYDFAETGLRKSEQEHLRYKRILISQNDFGLCYVLFHL